jgi:hypothetical protein
MERHEEENMHVLSLVQAMLGAITPNFRAVWLVCNPIGVRLHFLLEHESSEDREEIDDILFEFVALQSSGIDAEVLVNVDMRPWVEMELTGRMVYMRKEPV